ncbi:MAG: hypothetical protein KDK34_15610, partial [Leptospiraceae bacterium]|nr:hypothetical protein [Leptospiraceae bacterium]
GIHTAIVTHPDNQELLKLFQDGSDASQSTFDEVIAAPEQGKLRNTIMDYRTDILYLPDARLRTYMSTLFTGVKIKIGGSRLRLLSSLLRLHRVHQEKDLKRLKQKGFDLFPEMMSLKMDTTRIRSGRIPDVGRYVWLSLFDSHDLSGAWPPGHGARLTRMLKELDLQVLVPLPNGPQSGTTGAHAAEDHNRRRLERDVAYIKKHATNVHFLKDCSPEDRAAGMAAAQVIIAPAGPETVLASLMRRPVVILHDMRTYLNHPGHVPPPDSGKTKTRERRLRQPGALQIMSSPDFPLTSYIIKLANNLEKHIRPPVDHCKNDCPTCEYDSCVEFISPERVFESIKKIVLPF